MTFRIGYRMKNISEIIDNILVEWSYRVHDGMPNPKNPLHLIQLEDTLNELSLPRKVVKGVLEKVRKYKDNKMNQDLGRVGEPWGSEGTPPKKKEKDVSESAFVKMARIINEINYKDYKKDESATSKQKVNRAISEVNGKLYKIERIVNQNMKLKTEDGVDSTKYWKSTRNNLRRISERMSNIAEKLRRF